MLKRFDILDAKRGTLLFSGEGRNAQEIYEDWRRADLRPLEHPLPADLESEDKDVRLKALLIMNNNEDAWINDNEIFMEFRGVTNKPSPPLARDKVRKGGRPPNKELS